MGSVPVLVVVVIAIVVAVVAAAESAHTELAASVEIAVVHRVQVDWRPAP